jgi:hypothetical protein
MLQLNPPYKRNNEIFYPLGQIELAASARYREIIVRVTGEKQIQLTKNS